INLAEGEKIVVESDTKFTPYTASKATVTPKATSTAKPASTTKASATATPKASAEANDKNNPKTGDSAPIVGVSVLGAIALGAFAFLVIKNKKEN
ncbi:MAG: sortase B protein-sorting domain-containing protein, partial [Hominilimicola sp.]